MKAVDAQEVTYELDPGKTKIEFTVSATMHTVHGTFQLKHGLIHFNPITGEAGGMIVVDVKSGDTGNDGRDRKMHREVLQSERYPEATFKPVRIKGATDLRQNPTAEVEGVLNLHGADHSLTLNIPVRQQGEQLNAETQFVIPYVTWGMKNPSTFILHVSDKADMKISTSGHITYAGGNGSP
jgi:polyisoprenoid-binding protein YceI